MKPILGLAPMDGFTDNPCRNIAQDTRNKYGEEEKYDFFLRTEFMTADGFLKNPNGVSHHLITSPFQQKTIAQIFGGNKEVLVSAFKKVQQEYPNIFYGIELNMGCPANNIMRSGGGAELLKNKENALDIIKALRKNIKGHFSIKTRTGTNKEDKENQTNFLIKASPYIDMITIHARTTSEGYGPGLDRNFIYNLKEKLPTQKIIGNGGITSYQEIPNYIQNLDGIMIGQAAIGNPWVFTPHLPTNQEKHETILQHLKYIQEDCITHHQDKERKMLEFRKHLYSYVKGIPESKERKAKCNTIKNDQLLIEEINTFFGNKTKPENQEKTD